MRVLVVVIPEKGHVNPVLPTVRHLARRGHDVTVAAFDADVDLGAALRADVTAVRLSAPGAQPPRVTRGQEFAERLRDPAWLARWIEVLLVDAAPAQVAPLVACIERTRPDVIVADPMIYAAAMAAQQAQVPWAALSSSLNPVTPRAWRTALVDTLDRLDDKRRALFREHGLHAPRFFVSDVESPWLNVAFTVDAYAARLPDTRVFSVGAPFDDDDVAGRDAGVAFPWAALAPGGPLAFCSFGSQAFHQPALFRAIFRASERAGLRVVASAGDLVDDAGFMRDAPRDAIVARSVPQLALLPRVDVVVSHGGANSAVESLAFGKPLVLLPLCNDQPLQARFLAGAGAGVVVDAALPHHRLVPALERAFAACREEPVVARAACIGALLRSAGGPARAADLVEALARRREPLSPDEDER